METIALLALAFLIGGGQLNKENVQYVASNEEAKQEVYNPSETRLSDIIHTDLAVRFDWEKQHLHGTAEITAKPYFKPTNELVLDAKGFDIHSVKMGEEELSFQYENNKLNILLAKTYSRDDSYTVTIQYTAKPNELNVKGSAAISSAKGLYFINLGEEEKPQQIGPREKQRQALAGFLPLTNRTNG